jgi:hypothetical protein
MRMTESKKKAFRNVETIRLEINIRILKTNTDPSETILLEAGETY